jgi:hypothetical protein
VFEVRGGEAAGGGAPPEPEATIASPAEGI